MSSRKKELETFPQRFFSEDVSVSTSLNKVEFFYLREMAQNKSCTLLAWCWRIEGKDLIPLQLSGFFHPLHWGWNFKYPPWKRGIKQNLTENQQDLLIPGPVVKTMFTLTSFKAKGNLVSFERNSLFVYLFLPAYDLSDVFWRKDSSLVQVKAKTKPKS